MSGSRGGSTAHCVVEQQLIILLLRGFPQQRDAGTHRIRLSASECENRMLQAAMQRCTPVVASPEVLVYCF